MAWAERDWREHAACADIDPDFFFIEETEERARYICAGCPVRGPCLDAAMRTPSGNDGWGIRGGLSAAQRDARRSLLAGRRRGVA